MPVTGTRGPRSESMQAAVRAAIAQHGKDRAKVVGLVAVKFPTYSRQNISRSFTRVSKEAPPAAPAPPAAAPAPAAPAARSTSRKVVKVDGYADDPPAEDSDDAAVREPGAGNDAGRSRPPVAGPGAGLADPGGESGSGVDPGPVTRPVERVAAPAGEPARGRKKKRRRERSGPAYGHLFGW